MKVLIIEDEIPAQNMLVRLISKHFPSFTVVGIIDSIELAIKWLKENSADLIFMDVELSDGKCFEIFDAVSITCPVIITTAYENYALDAFKTKCIDYIMKPIDDSIFKQSVERCIQLCKMEPSSDTAHPHNSESSANQTNGANQAYQDNRNVVLQYTQKTYKHRFTIKVGSQIVVVNVDNIAYFYSEDKSTYIVTSDGKQYLSDLSLDSIAEEVDPARFFMISRGCLAGLTSICTISKYFNSRLKVTLAPQNVDPIIVPYARVQSFLEWLEGKS